MQFFQRAQKRESPEKFVAHVMAQLRHHLLWDSLLLFVPPLLGFVYVIAFLYRDAWIPQLTFISLTVVAIGVGLLAVSLRYRPLIPSLQSTARLVDDRAGAKDRFITLATIEPSMGSEPLLARLRREAAGLMGRVELKRDFPYKIKRSFYGSVVGSLIVVLLFHLLLPLAGPAAPTVPLDQQIRDLAEKMAQRPRLAELARSLQALATQLQDPNVAMPEKQKLIEETQKKVEEQQKKEEQKENQALLGEASSTLKGAEQQSGNNQQKDQDQGGGGVQSNLPQEGQGEGKQSQGRGGDHKGELNAQMSKDMQQGKTAQGDPKDQGKEKHQQNQGDGKGSQPDPNKADANRPDPNKGRENAGKTEGGSDDKVGKYKTPEEIPQGAPPAERFYQPGEKGKEGIKDARYVTVQLPEDVAADSKGEMSGTKESKENKVRHKSPVSNVPLPAHVPDAPKEKQQMPLEYRGIIR